MAEKKSIVFITNNGYRQPSSRIRCYAFAERLENLGFNSSVLSFYDHLVASFDGEESWKVGKIEKLKLILKSFFILIRENPNTVFYIQKVGYHAVAPYIISRLRKNPLVLDYDDYECFEEGTSQNRMLRKIAGHAALVVVASKALDDLFRPLNSNVEYIPTGTDIDLFKYKGEESRLGGNSSPNQSKVFCWIGIVSNEAMMESLLRLVKIFAENPGGRLEILGGGTMMELLKTRAQEVKADNVIFKGWQSPENIPAYLSTVDSGFLILDDNLYNRCKSPTKLFEYMAVGVIPVVPDSGEAARVIETGINGFKFANWEELSRTIKKVIDLPTEDLDQLRKKARQTVERDYSLDILTKKLAARLETVN